MGFLRLMDDFGAPNDDALAPPPRDDEEAAVGVVAVDGAERDKMDLGGAAKRALVTGGVSFVIALTVLRLGLGIGAG